MKKVTIPTCANPFVVIINGRKYTYPAGETMEVPDEVADVIEWHVVSQPKPEPAPDYNGGGASLNINYGLFEPKDTSKLWVKTSEPSRVIVSPTCDETEIEGLDAQKMALTLYTPNEGSYCGAIGSKIYMFGGYRASYYSNPSSYCYDTEAGTLTSLPSTLQFPQITGYAGGVTKDRKIYFFGGYDTKNSVNLSDIWCFDEDEMSLTKVGSLPEALSKAACAMVGDIVYITGGQTSGSAREYIYTFDTITHECRKLTQTLPRATYHHSAVTIGTNIYIISGTTNEVFCFDTLDMTIVTCGKTPVTNMYSIAIALGSKILVFGGQSSVNGSARRTIYCYDTVNNECKEEDETLEEAMGGAGNAIVADTLYLFGGKNGGTTLSSTQCVSFVVPVNIVNNGELFVKIQTNRPTHNLIDSGGIQFKMPIHSAYKGNADNIGEPVEMAYYKDGAWTNI